MKKYYMARGMRWEEGETPRCTYCDDPAVYATPVSDILLCNDDLCHASFITAECHEIELYTEFTDEECAQKERLARDLACELTAQSDTDVTPEQVEGWTPWDAYEWVESWGFEWTGEQWINAANREVSDYVDS